MKPPKTLQISKKIAISAESPFNNPDVSSKFSLSLISSPRQKKEDKAVLIAKSPSGTKQLIRGKKELEFTKYANVCCDK